MPLGERENHILVVDDEEAISEFICIVLKGENYRVTGANDGQEALDFLESVPPEETPSLILLDIRMPRMDGMQFIQIMEGRLPIIVMTASANPREYLQQPGVVDHLPKPFNLDLLLEKVNMYIHPPSPALVAACS